MKAPRIRDLLANVVLLLVSCIVSLYLAEIILRLVYTETSIPELSRSQQLAKRQQAAEQAGTRFDTRTKFQFTEELRRQGITAYPGVLPRMYLGRSFRQESLDLVPLGGISNATVVQCNESGEFQTYESDEHGFRNPGGVYTEGRFDFVLVGDSYVAGFCVGPDAMFSAHFSDAGYASYNLAMGGNGPLLELASLTEYAAPKAPAHVIWFFFEGNDFLGQRREYQNPILLRYFEPGFSQGLPERQTEVDQMHRKLIESEAATKLVAASGKSNSLAETVRSILRLKKMRLMFRWLERISAGPILAVEPTGTELQQFTKVMRAANSRVSAWGGELHFVYLPSWERFAHPQEHSALSFRSEVLGVVEELGIPSIDVVAAFDRHPDPLALFPFRNHKAHYNEEGYALASRAILEYLESARAVQDRAE